MEVLPPITEIQSTLPEQMSTLKLEDIAQFNEIREEEEHVDNIEPASRCDPPNSPNSLFESDDEIEKLLSRDVISNGLSYYDNQSTPSDIEMREFIVIPDDIIENDTQ